MFASPGNMGCAVGVTHTIPLTVDAPVTCPPRRAPLQWRDEVEMEVQRLLDREVIRPSNSAYAAPICPVRKKDGSIRLCIDYRALNRVTKDTAFPVSHLFDAIESLAGARYFTSIDLAQGYFQIPVDEADKEKTAFRTRNGLWEFNRMPFGLKGAPATFCRLMNTALRNLTPVQLALYMDDICLASDTFEEHLERLKLLFETLLHHGLRLRADKCQFAMPSVLFCGHQIGPKGIAPATRKLDAIRDWAVPMSPKAVKIFLGATGWYRRFIPDYATIVRPLIDIAEERVRFAGRWKFRVHLRS